MIKRQLDVTYATMRALMAELHEKLYEGSMTKEPAMAMNLKLCWLS
jgi:hypothetical protein